MAAAGLIATVGLAPAIASAATPASRAAGWLASQPTAGMEAGAQADVIVRLRMTGTTPARLRPRLARLRRVAPRYADTPGRAAKIVMAASAAGADPARLGGVDYLARMRRAPAAKGRYGTTAFDQGLSMIALRMAGRPVPGAAVGALRASRSGSGWSFDLDRSDPPDVDSTALSLIALDAAGVSPRSPVIRSAAAWLARNRDPGGGWSSGSGRPPNANSTGLAVQALEAVRGSAPVASLRFLRGLQQPSGAIAFTAQSPGSPLLATTDALPALAGVPLSEAPVRP